MTPTATRLVDVIHCPTPNSVQLKGLIGQRFHASRLNRLHNQEEDHLLWPFQKHCPVGYYAPDKQPYPGIRGDWQGEFMGTYLDAASISAWNAGDVELREKIDGMVADWLATQDPDGYLGTYDEADRWKSWDVWVQAHNLIGLASYYCYTGRKDILDAALRIGYRVLQDFGPGKRTLRDTGPHVGMASSAILEPIIWLYWESGDQAFLDFGRWLVEQDWEGEGGPQILSAILAGKGVAGVGNSKGIEMLLDFAGLMELYRATGEEKYLRTILLAWEDITAHHLYITGSASTGEYFPKDFALRNQGIYMIGETCVSMGWMYLNFSLARLTGDARYFDMAEQTLYNHLLGAQSPDGRSWAYYLGLADSKRYRWHTDPECCPTKGARGIAQTLGHVFSLLEDGVSVNFYDSAKAVLPLPSGRTVDLAVETEYPYEGRVQVNLGLTVPESFTLRLRLPGWCRSYTLALNGNTLDVEPDENGYLLVRREWTDGDQILFNMDMPVNVVVDTIGNAGRVALTRGPLVFAADASYLPAGVLLDDVILSLNNADLRRDIRVVKAQDTEGNATVHLAARRATVRPQTGEGFWREKERYDRLIPGALQEQVEELVLVPFLEAGNKSFQMVEGIQRNDEPVRSITFQVWLPYRLA
ncbi:MAG TPA: beta-L-arabinofuranosidase domain-containing protein [Anaerolineales bacterium]|nr:beta-L-arabinofuranosidase domain-containing protein [Anaerolineales bacterium]